MPVTTVHTPPDDRRFIALMALTAVAVVFAGFGSSYFLWPFTRATHFPNGLPISSTLPVVVHLHALLFAAWVLLLVAQARLVVRGRVARHRALGRLGASLVPLMLITGLLTAVQGGRDGWNPGGPYRDGLAFMFVGVADLTVFTVLTGAGLAWRQRPDLHKRLMLLGTTGGLMWPAITRMPILAGRLLPMFAVLMVLVLAPAMRDLYCRAQTRWITLTLGVAILATFPLRIAIGNSATWRALAAWLIA